MYGLLKWLTDPEKCKFVTLGYMPVKQESFDVCTCQRLLRRSRTPCTVLYMRSFLKTREEYEFYTAPQRPDYLGAGDGF